MKLSKRLTALFAAVLMAITMFTGSSSAYAKSPNSKTLVCGSYKATCSLATTNKYSGAAITDSASKDKNKNKIKFDALCATMFGTKVDKNGDNPKYISSSGTPKKMQQLLQKEFLYLKHRPDITMQKWQVLT